MVTEAAMESQNLSIDKNLPSLQTEKANMEIKRCKGVEMSFDTIIPAFKEFPERTLPLLVRCPANSKWLLLEVTHIKTQSFTFCICKINTAG